MMEVYQISLVPFINQYLVLWNTCNWYCMLCRGALKYFWRLMLSTLLKDKTHEKKLVLLSTQQKEACSLINTTKRSLFSYQHNEKKLVLLSTQRKEACSFINTTKRSLFSYQHNYQPHTNLHLTIMVKSLHSYKVQ